MRELKVRMKDSVTYRDLDAENRRTAQLFWGWCPFVVCLQAVSRQKKGTSEKASSGDKTLDKAGQAEHFKRILREHLRKGWF